MSCTLRAPPRPPRAAGCRAIEIVEALSAHSQHVCAPASESERLGLGAWRFGQASLVLTRQSSNLLYNRVNALGQASPATTGQVDRIIERARAHRAKVVAVTVGATARPRSLGTALLARGFGEAFPSAKLWRGAAPLPRFRGAGAIRVRRVRPADAAVWVDVVSRVWRTFGYRRPWFEARVRAPAWRHYLAWIEDQPVAAGALFVGTVGTINVGHLVDGVTLQPWRRRGAQSAIIRRRIADGRALGCKLFTSETAPPLPRMPLVSFRNLCRQGFELAYVRDTYKLAL